MMTIHFITREQLLHALRWLADSWAGEALAFPDDIVAFYTARSYYHLSSLSPN